MILSNAVKKAVATMLLAGMVVSQTACTKAPAPADQETSKETPTASVAEAPKETDAKLIWWVATTVNADEQRQPQENWYITKCLERFKEKHPGADIQITIQTDGMQTLQDFKAATVAGNGPDVMDFFSGPNLLSVKEGLLPLNEYITPEEKELIVGWDTVAEDLDPTKAIYAYPYPAQSAVFLSYNKELMQKAGLDLEKNPPKNLEEMDTILKTLKDNDILPFNSDESWPVSLYYFMNYWWNQQTGLTGLLKHATEKTPYAEDQGFLNVLAKYQEYYKLGYFNVDTATSADQANKFLQGECAFYPSGVWDFPAFTEAMGDKLGIIATPSWTKEGNPGIIGGIGAGLAVANYSKNPELAVELVKHVTSKEEMTEFYQINPGIPMRTDITLEDLGKADDALFSKVFELRENIIYWPDNCMSAEAGGVFPQFASQVLVGNMTPLEFAQKMDEAQS